MAPATKDGLWGQCPQRTVCSSLSEGLVTGQQASGVAQES